MVYLFLGSFSCYIQPYRQRKQKFENIKGKMFGKKIEHVQQVYESSLAENLRCILLKLYLLNSCAKSAFTIYITRSDANCIFSDTRKQFGL